MKVEIITIGDELLSGQTVDTNSSFIARKLADIGIEVNWKSTVGDLLEDMHAAFLSAWNRANIIIVTGGLGPTVDDITKKAICATFERKLVFHDDIVEMLEQRYARHNRKMPAMVQNQALQPQGAKFITNQLGSAVGIVIEEQDKYFVALPGVPAEMKDMIVNGIIPELAKLFNHNFIELRKIRTIGISEVEIAELLAGLEPADDRLKLAFLPSYQGVDLRITGKYPTETEAVDHVERFSKLIENKISDYIFTIGDNSLPEVVAALLSINKLTLSTAESCTGGFIAKLLTDIPGSSKYFIGSVVAYANEIKQSVLKVKKKTLDSYGAVSSQVAEEMAEGIRKISGSDFALSVTGIAGPDGGTTEKPVGLVYVGLASEGGVLSIKLQLPADRERVRIAASLKALELLRRELIKI